MAMSQELSDTLETDQLEHMVKMLSAYVRARSEATDAKRTQDMIGDLLKGYLERHPDEVIWDGETGIEACMKERTLPGKQYDLISLAKKDALLFQRLLEMGCLQVNAAAVKVQGAQVGGVEAYAFPQGKSKALSVEVKK